MATPGTSGQRRIKGETLKGSRDFCVGREGEPWLRIFTGDSHALWQRDSDSRLGHLSHQRVESPPLLLGVDASSDVLLPTE